MKIDFIYSTNSDDVLTQYCQRPWVGSDSWVLLIQGNDVITIRKCEIRLTLCNKPKNEHLSTINYSRIHKITKIP